MQRSKKRVIKSIDSLSEDLKELIKRQYPNGYDNNITRITNARKEPIFVFPLETVEATYLIKIPFTRNSEGENDMEMGNRQEVEEQETDDFGSSDGFAVEGGYEEETDRRSPARDPSYDPDFDN